MKYDIMFNVSAANVNALESFFEMKYDIIKLEREISFCLLESFFEMKYDIIEDIANSVSF